MWYRYPIKWCRIDLKSKLLLNMVPSSHFCSRVFGNLLVLVYQLFGKEQGRAGVGNREDYWRQLHHVKSREAIYSRSEPSDFKVFYRLSMHRAHRFWTYQTQKESTFFERIVQHQRPLSFSRISLLLFHIHTNNMLKSGCLSMEWFICYLRTYKRYHALPKATALPQITVLPQLINYVTQRTALPHRYPFLLPKQVTAFSWP